MFPGNRPPRPKHVAQIKDWFRQTFFVSPEANVMVTELACHEPDCPPLETVIALFEPGQAGRQWKLHKAIEDVTREDLEILMIDSDPHSGICSSTAPADTSTKIRGWRCPD